VGRAGYPITQPTSLFRIASCSKPLTKIAIHQLVEQEKLSLNDHIQRILNLHSPSGGTPPIQAYNVKVEHLIKHLGGWNVRAKEIPQLAFDPMFNDVKTAEAFGKSVPVTKYQIASYMTGQPMQFDPGTDPPGDQYSNYGYSLLGQIVEKKRPRFQLHRGSER
jgi:CubicO group peptidase (beta-lactamase class C family)